MCHVHLYQSVVLFALVIHGHFGVVRLSVRVPASVVVGAFGIRFILFIVIVAVDIAASVSDQYLTVAVCRIAAWVDQWNVPATPIGKRLRFDQFGKSVGVPYPPFATEIKPPA